AGEHVRARKGTLRQRGDLEASLDGDAAGPGDRTREAKHLLQAHPERVPGGARARRGRRRERHVDDALAAGERLAVAAVFVRARRDGEQLQVVPPPHDRVVRRAERRAVLAARREGEAEAGVRLPRPVEVLYEDHDVVDAGERRRHPRGSGARVEYVPRPTATIRRPTSRTSTSTTPTDLPARRVRAVATRSVSIAGRT